MAGHSKFSNIKHRKGAQDAKRGKIFAKLGREITVAAKGGGDIAFNPRLRTAIVAAKAENMPKDKIENAVRKGVGGGEGENYEEMRYEGYGTGGVAIIVEALTDNKNRAASDIRSTFSKHGGNLGESGSVNFMFENIGLLKYKTEGVSEEEIFEVALEAGAENCELEDDMYEVSCPKELFSVVRDALFEKFGDPQFAGLWWTPKTTTPIDESQASTLFKMIDVLEDNDDVQNVFANFDISDEVMEKLSQ